MDTQMLHQPSFKRGDVAINSIDLIDSSNHTEKKASYMGGCCWHQTKFAGAIKLRFVYE
jgi:hypothetical protein